jgi:hypothetical protein
VLVVVGGGVVLVVVVLLVVVPHAVQVTSHASWPSRPG